MTAMKFEDRLEREEELLTNAGFEHLTSIFRGLAIKGWLAFA